MHRRAMGVFAVLMVATAVSPVVSASVLVDDNFEYASQADFQAVWAPIGTVTPTSGVLSTTQANGTGTHSIDFAGTTTTGQNRNRLTLATPTGTVGTGLAIIWSFDFYDSAPTASPARNYANLQVGTAPGSYNELIAMGLNNNESGSNSGGQFYMARILGYTPPTDPDPDGGPTEGGTLASGSYFKLNDYADSVKRSVGWHNLKVVISSSDNLTTNYLFYVDGILSETVSDAGVGNSVRSYDNIVIGSGVSNASTEAFIDNMRLEVVPEPAAMTAIAPALLVLTRRRR